MIDKDETDLSAKQSAAKADPWVPRPDGVARRTPGAQTAAQQGSPPPDDFDPAQTTRVSCKPDACFGKEHRLRRSSDFLHVRRVGVRSQTAHFIIYLALLSGPPAARLGLAVSRQIGNAVARNRTKRRLRESFRCTLKPMLGPGAAVMVVARQGAVQLKTQEVTAELKPALSGLVRRLEQTASR